MDELGIAIITALSSVMQPQQATLLFAGDAMMHTRQIEVAKQTDGSYDYQTCFAKVAPLVSEADYAIVNLETPMAGAPYSGYPQFNAPVSYAQALKDAGFDLFLTANNHMLDRRDRGVRSTVKALDDLDVDHIGSYMNTAARDSILPFVKNINGFDIAFLNYTYGTNGFSIKEDVVIDYIDRKLMDRDIKKARDAGAELVCVTVHWGNEYKLLPCSAQTTLADYLLEAGADMVVGSHPHVIQPMELRYADDADPLNNRLVVYSLGNFISNMKTTDTRGGAMLRVHLKRDINQRPYIDSADYDLVFTIPGNDGGENFHLVYADSCENKVMKENCDAFRTSAKTIFDKHNINISQRK